MENKSEVPKDDDKSVIAEPCCCECCNSTCTCENVRKLSNNETMCCCVPLYVGMILIEYFTLCYILSLSIYTITLYDNAYIDAYYIIVILCLELLLMICLVLLCAFNRSKYKSKRIWPIIAIILIILTVIALTVWIMYYYLVKYKYDYVYSGAGQSNIEHNYSRTTKKSFIVGLLIC